MSISDCLDNNMRKACFHLPGLFEFYELYGLFLPLMREHPEYFFDWCEIGSIYGNPSDCIWAGGRTEISDRDAEDVLQLVKEYGISARLTFSNSLLKKEHLADRRCNELCALFEKEGLESGIRNGIIIHSELLSDYILERYPGLYQVSSTTKVLSDIHLIEQELDRDRFRYVVADFRLNPQLDLLSRMTDSRKCGLELICNECCSVECRKRRQCYENVSRINLGLPTEDYSCPAAIGGDGYSFSRAMKSPTFISNKAVHDKYLPAGITEFKIEGRGLGSAIILEFLLYYLTRPEYYIHVRERIYLNNSLDLF